MKKKRILFMVGLYSLVVGSIVYIGVRLPVENVEEPQVNQRDELAQSNEGKQLENGDIPEEQDGFVEPHLREDEEYLNRDTNGNQKNIISENQRSNSSINKGSTSEKTTVENPPVKNRSQDQEKEPAISDNTKDEKGTEEKMTNKETVLSSLGTGYEIQDNRDVDRWGVVIKIDRLPEELRTAKGYTVSIGEKTYELRLNKYNSNVFNTQVSSIEHTKEQIEQAIITTN